MAETTGNISPNAQGDSLNCDNETGVDGALEAKQARLRARLRTLAPLAIAFSSGVDSTYLLAEAAEVLGDQVIAVTARSAAFPRRDTEEAIAFCADRSIRQIVVDFDICGLDAFRDNPVDRCYHCKLALMGAVIAAAREAGFPHVAEGSNGDDMSDYRPGLAAVRELGLESPLRDAGLTKADIRALSRAAGLPTADKPSAACLASRFPYGRTIDEAGLARVEAAENFLHDVGLSQVRVRLDGDGARIEALGDEMARLATSPLRESVVQTLQDLGFTTVTLDLAGYRMGSLNPPHLHFSAQ